MFSKRTAWRRDPNPLTRAIDAARARYDVLDLTASNPTGVQLPMDREAVAAALAEGAKADYQPAPLGLPEAREAIAGYYGRRGVPVAPEQVVITATTSEAYAFLFRLLADPGEAVLAAAPSYPLFDFLAESAEIRLERFRLAYDRAWRVDPEALEAALAPDIRALLVVSPGNPTGACPGPVDRRRLVRAARDRDLSLVSDEVFLDYLDAPERFGQVSFAREAEVRTFTLSGLSKVAALPHLKLSWIVLSGPEAAVEEARGRLEILADTFLSVATPVQRALPRLLEQAEETQDFLRDRIWENAQRLAESGLPVRARDGGWYAIVDLPAGADDEAVAIRLVEEAQVITQPGYLFDLEDQALVLSLLPPPEDFGAGVDAIRARISS